MPSVQSTGHAERRLDMVSLDMRHTMYTDAEFEALNNAHNFRNVDAMHASVPALFTTSPHPSLSERYSFTNTYEIVLSMLNRGYKVTSVMGGQKKYAKMLIRMRHSMYDQNPDGAPEVVLKDSHDGSSSLWMMMGWIRYICGNGMVAADALYSRTFQHRAPDLQAQVMLEMEEVHGHELKLENIVKRMRDHSTTEAERMLIADAATVARFGPPPAVSQSFMA